MSNAINPSSTARRDAIILDVDGTLCDVRPVRHFVQAPPGAAKFKPNFNLFHSASANCLPHARVRQLAIHAHSLGLAVVVVTAREAKWRDLTIEWLAKHGLPCDELQTRSCKDYRADHVVKAEIELDISQRFRALLAVDDRLDIIAVWHAAGIATVRVTEEGSLLPVAIPPGTAIDGRVVELLGEPVPR